MRATTVDTVTTVTSGPSVTRVSSASNNNDGHNDPRYKKYLTSRISIVDPSIFHTLFKAPTTRTAATRSWCLTLSRQLTPGQTMTYRTSILALHPLSLRRHSGPLRGFRLSNRPFTSMCLMRLCSDQETVCIFL